MKPNLLELLKSKFFKSSNFKNAYWSVADVVIYPVVLLIATPIFLKYLGAEQYGIWVLINSIIASIGVLNAGLGDATIKFISKYRALQDTNSVVRVFRSTYTLTCCVAAFATIGIVISSDWLVSSDLFKIEVAFQPIAITALRLAAFAFALKLLEQIFFSYFKAYERFDIFSKISIVSRTVALLAGIGFVLTGSSIVAIIVCNLAATLLSVLVEIFLISRRLGLSVFIPSFSKPDIKEVFSFSSWAWMQTGIGLLSAQLDRYIVAAAVSVEVLAYYSIGLLVAMQIHNVFAAGSGFIFPLISKKIEKQVEIRHIYYKMQLIVILSGLTGIVALILVQEPLFTLWLGEESYLRSQDFITLFLCYEAALLTSVIPYYYLIGSGHIKLNTIIMAISTGLMSISMLILFYFMGENGLIWGKIISIVVVSPFLYNALHRRVLNDKDPWAGLKILLPSFAVIVFILLPSIPVKVVALLLCIYFFYKFFYQKARSIEAAEVVVR